MEDISIEQRKSFLNREKGLELQAIYNSLLPHYFLILIRILKFAFALGFWNFFIHACRR